MLKSSYEKLPWGLKTICKKKLAYSTTEKNLEKFNTYKIYIGIRVGFFYLEI